MRVSRLDPLEFLAARRLGGALLRNQLFPAARERDPAARDARGAGIDGAAGDAALPAQPALPVQYAQLDLDLGAAEADRARQRDARAAVVVPALYAGQRAHREGHACAGGRDAEALSREREDAVRGSDAATLPDRAGDDRRAASVAAAPAADSESEQKIPDPAQ